MSKSVEEQVEDRAKKSLDACEVHHFAKNESINSEIDAALKNAPSKKGGKGANFPDIKVLVESSLALIVTFVPMLLSGRISDDACFVSLMSAVRDGGGTFSPNVIYELDAGECAAVSYVSEDGQYAVLEGDGGMVIRVEGSYSAGDKIKGPRWFKALAEEDGREQSVTNQILHELSRSEEDELKKTKQRAEKQRLQREYEETRGAALRVIRQNLAELTDDGACADEAYQKILSFYDVVYEKMKSHQDAKEAAEEFAPELLAEVKNEFDVKHHRTGNEFQEWVRTHPEEYAEEMKVQEEVRKRKREESREKEIKETLRRMSEIQSIAECFRQTNAFAFAPENLDEMRRFSLRDFSLSDAWGEAFGYRSQAGSFRILSRGPDRKAETEDDLIVDVESPGKDDWPVSARIRALQMQISEQIKMLDSYRGKIIPSICGFKFGTPGWERERVVKLARPFRDCSEAILQYYGTMKPRLASVCLLAKYRDDAKGVLESQTEGLKVISLIERNYGVKMTVAKNPPYFVGQYLGDDFEIVVRNDQFLRDCGESHPLFVRFDDIRLKGEVEELDFLFSRLEKEECILAKGPCRRMEKEVPASETDDGFDVLSSEEEQPVEDLRRPYSCAGKRQTEEIPKLDRALPGSPPPEGRSRSGVVRRPRRTGIIEAKGEGRPISTTEAIPIPAKLLNRSPKDEYPAEYWEAYWRSLSPGQRSSIRYLLRERRHR